jgi:hypothetical protein
MGARACEVGPLHQVHVLLVDHRAHYGERLVLLSVGYAGAAFRLLINTGAVARREVLVVPTIRPIASWGRVPLDCDSS